MIPGAFPIIAGAAKYRARAVRFDGATTYVGRTSALSGVPTGNKCTFSCWVKFNGAAPSGDVQQIFCLKNSGGGNPVVNFYQDGSSTNRFRVSVTNSGGSTVIGGVSAVNTLPTNTGTWRHLAFSGDGSSKSTVFIDGVATNGFTSGNSINFARDTPRIGRNVGGANLPAWLNADVAELWFTTTYLDLTVSANLAKFRTGLGKPVFLGLDGSLPTGAQPAVYLSGPASSFASNKGFGGNFSVSGSLVDAPTSPSD